MVLHVVKRMDCGRRSAHSKSNVISAWEIRFSIFRSVGACSASRKSMKNDRCFTIRSSSSEIPSERGAVTYFLK